MVDDPVIFTPPPPATLAGAVLRVDLGALQANWRRIAGQVAPAMCAAAVKGDAYGLGIEPCSRALWAAGCRTFFVALPHEAITLRAILPNAHIYVLNGLFDGHAPLYGEHTLRPVLASVEEVEAWAAHCRGLGEPLPAAIHVDSGINRLGLSVNDVVRLTRDFAVFDHFDLSLVVSHLALGDESDHEMNPRQREQFDRVRAMLPEAPASLANSAGSFLGQSFAYDIVRPGIALFGGNPLAGGAQTMEPVAHVHAKVLQVREVSAGETVGYGAIWRAKRAARIAVLSIGYRDGYPRLHGEMGGEARIAIAGRRVPLAGRVSMDLICADVSELPPHAIKRGDEAEIMGANVRVDEIALWSGTIPYEILTRLASRHARLYSGGDF